MSDNEVILRLTTTAVLVAFLCFKQWERIRKRAGLRRQLEYKGVVTPINVAPLKPCLEAVRKDFARMTQIQHRSGRTREGLVAVARRKLGGLSFFRQQPARSENEQRLA